MRSGPVRKKTRSAPPVCEEEGEAAMLIVYAVLSRRATIRNGSPAGGKTSMHPSPVAPKNPPALEPPRISTPVHPRGSRRALTSRFVVRHPWDRQ